MCWCGQRNAGQPSHHKEPVVVKRSQLQPWQDTHTTVVQFHTKMWRSLSHISLSACRIFHLICRVNCPHRRVCVCVCVCVGVCVCVCACVRGLEGIIVEAVSIVCLTNMSFWLQLREEHGTIMVMLFDFQHRKFQRRSPKEDEETNPFYIQVRSTLLLAGHNIPEELVMY